MIIGKNILKIMNNVLHYSKKIIITFAPYFQHKTNIHVRREQQKGERRSEDRRRQTKARDTEQDIFFPCFWRDG